jgi:hypothetical protein
MLKETLTKIKKQIKKYRVPLAMVVGGGTTALSSYATPHGSGIGEAVLIAGGVMICGGFLGFMVVDYMQQRTEENRELFDYGTSHVDENGPTAVLPPPAFVPPPPKANVRLQPVTEAAELDSLKPKSQHRSS